jgi:hypothetical protein
MKMEQSVPKRLPMPMNNPEESTLRPEHDERLKSRILPICTSRNITFQKVTVTLGTVAKTSNPPQKDAQVCFQKATIFQAK